MLTQVQATQLAQEYQTTTDNIIKEHYQMYVLDMLYRSPFGLSLVFKGGTALRLAYQSFRFSEDLDFSVRDKLSFSDFSETLQSMTHMFPEMKINDLYDKRQTLYAKLIFRLDFKPIPFGIKIEVNKDAKHFDHTIALFRSPTNSVEVVGKVYTLQSILQDKMMILEKKLRRQPRDIFDAWYIHQKLQTPFEIRKEHKYSRKEMMDGLSAFLPANKRQVMELFIL